MQRRATNIMAAMAVMAIVVGQPTLSPCQCAASPGNVCCATAKAPEGDIDRRSDAAACECCCPRKALAERLVGCCCEPSTTAVAAATVAAQVRPVHAEDAAFIPATPPRLADFGLLGADWVNAFDLEALGRPPRLRLHALLCVWRN